MIKIIACLLVAAAALTGCGKTPEAVMVEVAKATPTVNTTTKVETAAPAAVSAASAPKAAATKAGSVQDTLGHCSWDRPGVNPFMGDVVAAVDRYEDIPQAVRETLKKRMTARKYDEIATIKRDSIVGDYQYSDLRDMHFGKGTVCKTVTRERWLPETEERGLVYCESGHCIIVPTVCRNVSRVTRVIGERNMGSTPVVTEGGGGVQITVMPSASVTRVVVEEKTGSFAHEAKKPEAPNFGGFEPAKPVTFEQGGGPVQPGLPGVTTNPTPTAGTSVTPDGDGDIPGIGDGGAVPVAPVPEPSEWAMILLGLGMVGLMAHRRRGAMNREGEQRYA